MKRKETATGAEGSSRIEAATITIGDRRIGPAHRPFIVAELSGNHNGALDRALSIVEAAARAGAHAVKLQTYTADTMTLDIAEREFVVSDPASPWHGRTLHDLYEEAHTPWVWHEPLMERCRDLGLACFSTPFDAGAVDFLESLGAPCYKIASFELLDLPLIERVARTGKPVIMSTGMAMVEEIGEAVDAARGAGCRDLVLLQCTSSYPASPEHSNIATIIDLARRFRCQVGLSDHTLGIGAAVAAVALGATIVEKHFTISRADGGVDAAFSLEPDELAALVVETERAWQAIGEVHYGPTDAERGSLAFRRSLYVVRDMKAGDVIGPDSIRAIRPGLGLPPKHTGAFVGKPIARDVVRGTPVTWDMLAPSDRPKH